MPFSRQSVRYATMTIPSFLPIWSQITSSLTVPVEVLNLLRSSNEAFICFEKSSIRFSESLSPDNGSSSSGPPTTVTIFGISGTGDPIPFLTPATFH